MNELDAPAKLRGWMGERNLGTKELAATLLVSRSAVSDWRMGRTRPPLVHRVALEQMTGGRIRAAAWAKGTGRSSAASKGIDDG